jgi:hypothetical protein
MSDNFDLLMEMKIAHKSTETLEDIKNYLIEVGHEEKDNASFIYNFYQYCKEPMCIK